MEPGLIFGLAVSVVSLSVRWRFPTVPQTVATFGIVVGAGVAVWSLTSVPGGLAVSLILNVAFVAVLIDNWLSAPPDRQAVAAIPDDLPPYNEKRIGLSNALIEIHEARRIAKLAVAERRKDVTSTVSYVDSAFATIRGTFDVDTPATANDRDSLKLSVAYLDVVWPPLKNGNYDLAKAKAAHFIVDRQGGQIREA